MRLPRYSLLLALIGSTSVGACFGDQASPSTFRHTCDADGDCREDEACLDGLCQFPCTQATFEDDCPAAGSYAACLNGACASICTLPGEGKKDPCPDPQTCIDLGFLGGGGGGFLGGGGGSEPVGVCGAQCSENTCPSGEACLEGFCVASCSSDEECMTGLICAGGLCIPDLGGGSDTGGGGSDTSTGGTTQ